MFVHQERLQHLLRPEHYVSPDQYEIEVERLFRPAWRLVGCRADLPGDGDFRTLDVSGVPLLLRNFDGEVHAFLNVCAHRHCRITSIPQGNSPALRCQYHGWEYESSGRTRKIPDARCFRPWDRENACLKKFRTAWCGDLLFVSLADEGPGLEDYLGEHHAEIARCFSGARRHVMTWAYSLEANWKALVENTLESYHLPEVHGESFANIYPSEEGQTHELTEARTVLWFEMAEVPRVAVPQRRLARYLGGQVVDQYIHRHFHPGLVVINTDLNSFAVEYSPLGPTRSEVRHIMYGLYGDRRSPLAWLTRRFFHWFARRSYCRLAREDGAIGCEQQKGISHSPFPGCIGTREERIFTFHEYILKHTADAPREDGPGREFHASKSLSPPARSRPSQNGRRKPK